MFKLFTFYDPLNPKLNAVEQEFLFEQAFESVMARRYPVRATLESLVVVAVGGWATVGKCGQVCVCCYRRFSEFGGLELMLSEHASVLFCRPTRKCISSWPLCAHSSWPSNVTM